MRLIISAATVALIAASVIGVAWVVERNAREALTAEIESRLLMEARNLASVSTEALLTDYPELTLCPVVSEIQADREDLAFVVVLDHEGAIQGHVNLRRLGSQFELRKSLYPQPARHELGDREEILGNEKLLVASVPAIHSKGQFLGTALVGLRRSYLEGMITRSRKELVLLTAGLLGLGIASALILMSILLRPVSALRAGLERIGRGDLDTPLQMNDRTELGLLAETVNSMADQLKVSQREMLEKERLDHEMELARSMQQSLLPEAPIKAGDFVIEGAYEAAAEVGGDYYDVFRLPDGKVGVVIADVSGKGLGGCMVTSMLAVLIQSLRDTMTSPKALLLALEEALLDSLRPGVFITIFYGLLDPGSGRLTYASAAHSPLLILRGNQKKIEWCRTRGIPLGAVRQEGALAQTLEDYVVDLSPHDVAVQFTDGVSEAWSASLKEEFGFTRIEEVVEKNCDRGGSTILTELLRRVDTWTHPNPPGDDRTLLVICRAGSPGSNGVGSEAKTSLETRDIGTFDEFESSFADAAHLQLKADMSQLARLGTWIECHSDSHDLIGSEKHHLESGLYEVCANIIEHGYGGDRSQAIDIWWLGNGEARACFDLLGLDKEYRAIQEGSGEEACTFVVCDRGAAYDPGEWGPVDLNDPQVRQRGRGLGLQMIHSSMTQVMYLPATSVGNLTLLSFDPVKHRSREEISHV